MNRYTLKVNLLMIYYWIFNHNMYRMGKKLRKVCKSPEVQEAFKEAITTVFERIKSNQEESNGSNNRRSGK